MKPCPNCESISITMGVINGGYGRCEKCGMTGPSNDPQGIQWDTLPRRGDVEKPPYNGSCKCPVCGSDAEMIIGWVHCSKADCIWGPTFWSAPNQKTEWVADRQSWQSYAKRFIDAVAVRVQVFGIGRDVASEAIKYADDMLSAEGVRFDNPTEKR